MFVEPAPSATIVFYGQNKFSDGFFGVWSPFGRLRMRRTIERWFEAVEANAGLAVLAIVTSFAVTSCLHLFWE